MSNKPIKVSASRVKQLNSCSYIFYLKEVLKLPESVHPKTRVGSCLHAIMECLMKPKRKKDFDFILNNKFVLSDYPNIIRLIRAYAFKYNLDSSLTDPIEEMVETVFLAIRPYFLENPNLNYTVEERFQIKVGDAEISGFIDLLIRLPDRWVIIDYKTQGKRFTANELKDNIQAAVYQLAVWMKYKEKSTVEFIMARHPPTKRTPEKHIQRVNSYEFEHLIGLQDYIKWLYGIVQNFSLQDAYSNFCKDKGFCTYVCQFKNKFDYRVVLNKDTREQISSYFLDEEIKLGENEVIEERSYGGCPLWN